MQIIKDGDIRAPTSPWRASIAAGLGTAIEYYDFQLYAVLAVTLSPLFFSTQDPNTALLSTLAIFAGAFVARPLGGVFFGLFGDRYGRTAALMLTVVGIGVASALIGLLPTYAVIGVAAPMLLLFLRLMQGFFAGGEITGAATYIAECSPPDRRGFFGAFNPAAATLGLTAATAVAGLTGVIFGSEATQEWAWRIPFLLSIPLIALCLWARFRIEDSPKFRQIMLEHKVVKAPLKTLFTEHRRAVLQVISIGFAQNAAGYVSIIYLNIHLTRTLGYDPVAVFWLISITTFIASLFMPFVGGLSDRFGRKPLLTIGFAGYIVLTPITFYAASLGSFAMCAAAVVLGILPFIIVQAVGYPLYAELFPTRVRYSGVSLGFNIATILGGGTAPYIAAWLTAASGHHLAPSAYVVVAAIIGLTTLVGLRETADRPLEN
ncbi:MFS transporter [Kineobactrum salinum]|uniref:MHS family MFS transporter n=1 Tax=Kineobactrum salinum TaxID=2708301 RepID=A0A6C0TY37_9GAMM|nr:MFS transporter [Kineobactrum salinum]QIB64548.1 MHS family MFS transporter [Kineobactrum salinum]